MKKIRLATILLVAILSGCISKNTSNKALQAKIYDDLTKDANFHTVAVPGKVYRLGETGICGTVEKDHIKVTHIIPGSVADGKIQVNDLMRGMQHRSMGGWGGIPNLVRIRLYRIGRDWDWHFYVTVERPSLRNGKGNTLTYDLHVPPAPGNICHYGPTGFYAKRHSDHLVVDVIEKGSPSDGQLKKGDLILAVDGNPITTDAYNQFCLAVDKAESHEGKGFLRLQVKRSGKLPTGSTATIEVKKKHKAESTEIPPATQEKPLEFLKLEVVLKLKTFGSYAKNAPTDCAKTDALITQTADHIVKNSHFGKLNWGLLGLLATGEKKYIKVVADFLHDPKKAEWAQPPKNKSELITSGGYVTWHWGYRNLLMTEYYLLTGDKSVLPAITQLSRTLAAGQDQAGLWGHRMARANIGRAHGYGVMNQPTLSIFISLILAQKCGVKDKMVDLAIKRTHDHYDKWVGKGALPYGNHGPSQGQFTNNGTSGSLAVAFALIGNKKGASFYGAMSAAATEEILLGHGGPRWNILWSGLGSGVLGPVMTTAYNNEIHWLRTITRTWNGSYTSLKGWGAGSKPDLDWSTGGHLINICAGRRKIAITGKGMDSSIWVKAMKAEEIVAAGKIDRTSTESLLRLLGSPYPPVRIRAAQALAMRDAKVHAEIISFLTKGTQNQKIGAIHAIGNLKLESLDELLYKMVVNDKEDLWVRQLAVKAINSTAETKKYIPNLLELLVREKTYDLPYMEFDLALGSALLKLTQPDPYKLNLDKKLFYKGVIKLLQHKHNTGRGIGMQLINNLPIEDLNSIIDMMIHVIEDKDKNYTSYSGGGRVQALEILYRLGIKESMDYTLNTILDCTRGGMKRARVRLLKTFGAEAKYLIPQIKEILGKGADPVIKQIEAATTNKKMIPLKEAREKVK